MAAKIAAGMSGHGVRLAGLREQAEHPHREKAGR
jgi:hypothetical protein